MAITLPRLLSNVIMLPRLLSIVITLPRLLSFVTGAWLIVPNHGKRKEKQEGNPFPVRSSPNFCLALCTNKKPYTKMAASIAHLTTKRNTDAH